MSVALRHPTVEDGPAIHALVGATGILDVNSRYAYLAHCRHFAATSVVAVGPDGLAGFVTGYRLPDTQDVLFVWQVGVDAAARGQGLATRMLRWLLQAPACADVRWLHTTITPSNEASRGLFRGLAAHHDVPCVVEPAFPASLLGQGHEAEELFRIGPFRTTSGDPAHGTL